MNVKINNKNYTVLATRNANDCKKDGRYNIARQMIEKEFFTIYITAGRGVVYEANVFSGNRHSKVTRVGQFSKNEVENFVENMNRAGMTVRNP